MSFKNPIFKIVRYEDPVMGGSSYRLLNIETGERVPFYTEFLNGKKESGSRANSVKAYAYDLYPFLSFMAIASELLSDILEGIKSPLAQIVSAYPEFLVLGNKSPRRLIQRAATILGWAPVKASSQKRYLSSVNEFLKASAKFQQVQRELSDLGLLNTLQSPAIFGEELTNRRELKSHERKALIQRSFIAGVVSGGAKLLDSTFFSFKMADKQHGDLDERKAFPLESTLDTINNATNARDQALWALLLGTGIRISEAFNMLMQDIDPLNELVVIIDPNTRPLEFPVKPGRSATFNFKGRKTKDTYFIEPFRSIFFKALKQYLHERPITNHRVLFVSLAQNKGEPLYWAENSNTYNKPLKKAAAKAGVIGHTAHSFRHTYGFFMANYIPTPEGLGLPLIVVQLMMGHSNISSTAVYAKIDKVIARKKLEKFNRLVQKKGLIIENPNTTEHRVDRIYASQNIHDRDE